MTTENEIKPTAPVEALDGGRCALADLFGSGLLCVEAGVRYWEDATVNGAEDTEGTLIPLRSGELWKPVIELATGQIRDWPQGTTADIHYKVCDAGEYYIANIAGKRCWKYSGDYVPDKLLCHGDRGYGDYIIFKVSATGKIEGWSKPTLDTSEWHSLQNTKGSRPNAAANT